MVEMVHVSKAYTQSPQALRDITLQVEKGKFVYLVGPSGAGKTTLLKLLYAAERPTEGEIWVNGVEVPRLKPREIPSLRRNLGIVFQDLKLLPRWTVFENVALALEIWGGERKDIIKRAVEAIRLVGLEGKSSSLPSQLSAGELQRVAIARAIVNNPPLVLADEPIGNVGLGAAEEILKLFADINLRGTTLILATQNQNLPALLPKEIIVLENGRLLENSLSRVVKGWP